MGGAGESVPELVERKPAGVPEGKRSRAAGKRGELFLSLHGKEKKGSLLTRGA